MKNSENERIRRKNTLSIPAMTSKTEAYFADQWLP
jgi:hypothetical protein